MAQKDGRKMHSTGAKTTNLASFLTLPHSIPKKFLADIPPYSNKKYIFSKINIKWKTKHSKMNKIKTNCIKILGDFVYNWKISWHGINVSVCRHLPN